MRIVSRTCVVMAVMMAVAAPALAQGGTGISAALVGDIVRVSGGDGLGQQNGGGEAVSFSLRVDRALAGHWGVELEYMRGGEIELTSVTLPPIPVDLAESRLQAPFSPDTALVVGGYSYRSTVRESTLSTLGWYRQTVGERTSLVYSAGMAFGIATMRATTTYQGLPNQNTLPGNTSRYTSYSVFPTVGLDARIHLAAHASVVPGIRLVGASNGLLIRPAVGLRWEF